MSIIFKPPGTLDINTDPSSLPEQSDGKTIMSGAMTRCKNLRLNQSGVLVTRDGSQKMSDNQIDGIIDFIIEQSGDRYTFAGDQIYKNEVLISGGIQCETPELSPDSGSYAGTQTVIITTDTRGALIYYTLNGNTPDEGSEKYGSSITVVPPAVLKAVAIKTGFSNSAIKTGMYQLTSFNLGTEGGNTLVTETDGNNLVNEGAS